MRGRSKIGLRVRVGEYGYSVRLVWVDNQSCRSCPLRSGRMPVGVHGKDWSHGFIYLISFTVCQGHMEVLLHALLLDQQAHFQQFQHVLESNQYGLQCYWT
jgi:hypothetical protein